MNTTTEMNTIEIKTHGAPDVLTAGRRPLPKFADNEVLIKIAAAGVNGPDLLQRRGLYPPPPGASDLLGLEVSGVIAAVGDKVVNWRKGESVCALTNGGGYADFVGVNAQHCLPIPEGVDLIDAAGLPETFFTIWSNIFFQHEVKADSILLVHGGAGGIGSAAIQIGANMGLRIFATVGDDDAADWCIALGAERAINFRNDDFVSILRDAGGADIIVDIIGGDYIARNIKAARADARIIQLAFNQGSKVEIDLMPMMLKRLNITGSTLRSRPDAFKAGVAEDLRERVWPLLANGKIQPTTFETFPLKDAVAAHEMMETKGKKGKILLIP